MRFYFNLNYALPIFFADRWVNTNITAQYCSPLNENARNNQIIIEKVWWVLFASMVIFTGLPAESNGWLLSKKQVQWMLCLSQQRPETWHIEVLLGSCLIRHDPAPNGNAPMMAIQNASAQLVWRAIWTTGVRIWMMAHLSPQSLENRGQGHRGYIDTIEIKCGTSHWNIWRSSQTKTQMPVRSSAGHTIPRC